MGPSRTFRLIATAVQTAALAGLALYVARLVGGHGDDALSTWLYNGLILVAGVLCLTRAAVVKQDRGAWLLLGAGLLSWFAGELYFTVALADLEVTPFPSLSDALALAFYPASYVAIVMMMRARVRRFQASMWLDGLIGALGIGSIAAALFLQPILISTGRGTAEVATTLAYPVGDIMLLALVAGVFALMAWHPGKAWMLVGAGLATMACADGAFLYLSASDSYVEGSLLDALWPGASLLLSYAAWQPPRPAARVDLVKSRVALIAPALFAAGALGLIVWERVGGVNTIALVLATATIGAVVARMALTHAENLRLLDKIEEEATTDALTSLGNRRKLVNDLEAAFHEASTLEPRTLVLFDLDGFKDYNDSFGHPAGDALLSRLGGRLESAIKPQGSAYRLGGDEFCAVLPGALSRETLARLSADVLTESGEGFSIESSFGNATFPDEASNVSEALRLADTRLYRHKERGGRATALNQARDVLLQALVERDPTLSRHVKDVTYLALALSRRLEVNDHDLREIACAAQLHDVGKIAIPDAILDKPGPLDASEWKLVRRHTLVGDRIIRAAPTLAGVARLVRHSHERWDGHGYPGELAGENIPLGSRIILACDAFTAMTSERPYQERFTVQEALAELRRNAGSQFDPQVVTALCAEIELGLAGEPHGDDRPQHREQAPLEVGAAPSGLQHA